MTSAKFTDFLPPPSPCVRSCLLFLTPSDIQSIRAPPYRNEIILFKAQNKWAMATHGPAPISAFVCFFGGGAPSADVNMSMVPNVVTFSVCNENILCRI